MRWRTFKRGMQEAWPFWLWSFGVLVAFGFGLLTSRVLTEEALWGRYASGYLQVGGLLVVVYGLASKVGLSGRTIPVRVLEWFRRTFVSPKPVRVMLGTAGSIALAGLSARVRTGVREGAPLEEQVAALRRELTRVQDRIDKLEDEHSKEVKSLREELAQEQREREAADKSLREHQVQLTFDGWEWELIGVGWFFVSILVGTFF